MDERLAILIKHLPALREQGVSSLELDGLKVHLLPTPPEEPAKVSEESQRAGRNPLRYGLPEGTQMPTLRGPR